MGRLAEGQRRLLEQLMGAEAMGIVQVDLRLTDAKVCKNFTCGVCPHDLFSNTRMDLGQCPHTHSGKLKSEYEAAMTAATDASSTAEMSYTLQDLVNLRNEYERNIVTFVDDCDRRIRAAQRRLEKTPEENNKTTALMREIGEIQTAYDVAMTEVENLGSSGKVDESMAELAKAEALKAEKQEKERELQAITENAGASGHQKLRVCDICGAYLSILDSDRRLADHFGGKMHLGYLQLRQTIDEWKERGPNQQPGRAQPAALAPSSNQAATVPKQEEGAMPPPPAPASSNGMHIDKEDRPPTEERDRSSRHRDDRDRDRDHRDSDRYSRRHDDDRRSSRYDDGYSSSRHSRDRDREHRESSRSDRPREDRDRDSERRRKTYDDGYEGSSRYERDAKRSRYD